MLELLHIMFFQFVPELWPLIYAKILFPVNILRTNLQNLQFYMCIHIDKIDTLGLLHINFFHNCTRVIALDLRQNFISAQYLENKWTDFHQTLYDYLIDKIYVGLLAVNF